MFGGRLPEIPIRLSKATTYLGQCVSRIKTLADGRREHYDFELRFSTSRDLPKAVIEDTIIHEMIHYFIHYNGLADTSAHGPVFRAIMNSINTIHGRKLTISHKDNNTSPADTEPTLAGRWHVIAVLHLSDTDNDKIGIKVLPRSTERVLEYYRRVSESAQVSKIDLYLHNNSYFDRYPTSAALRYHPASLSEISPYLTGARPLTVNGNRLE